eukprot:TRINITY_DN16961_c0_g1_i1.p2 TRINITY_DN16961_c0_g1~~TRINITY_DN16961_c0_g1_i1.p2  ORF type:complete len:114 (+),score=14.22 TRINITY_DN16961_c0_g1_i1:272-613(+)
MAMYYPQKTELELGPTEIKPGTQYCSLDPQKYSGTLPNPHLKSDEKIDFPVVCEEGSVVIIHYDIVHRGGWNKSQKDRFMFKFQFFRLEEPKHPTWCSTNLNWERECFFKSGS